MSFAKEKDFSVTLFCCHFFFHVKIPSTHPPSISFLALCFHHNVKEDNCYGVFGLAQSALDCSSVRVPCRVAFMLLCVLHQGSETKRGGALFP